MSQEHSSLQNASGVSQLKSRAAVNIRIQFLIIFNTFPYTFRIFFKASTVFKGFLLLFVCLLGLGFVLLF